MAEHRSTAEEAVDPGTSPERLLELTERHPQLHRLIVSNPSTPEVARQWILATNPWAKQAPDEATPDEDAGGEDSAEEGAAEDEDDPDEGEPTQLHQAVPDERPEEDPAEDPDEEPDDSASAWGDFPEALVWGGAGAAGAAGAAAAHDPEASEPSVTPPPAPPAQRAPVPQPAQGTESAAGPSSPSSTVRLSPQASVVPLGAATGPSAAAGAQNAAPGPAAAAPAAAAVAADDEDEDDDGSRRKAWIACGGCLVLALLLLLVIGLGARALLSSPEDEGYTRDSSTTSEESASEDAAEEPTEEETTEEDPVSPAPEGAQEMNALRSPTGNISCTLEEDSVSCSLEDSDYSGAGLEDCGDDPFTISVAGEEAGRACGDSVLSDSAETLEYESSAVRGDMACTSRSDGMTCWNTMTGHGFMVNRASYETF